jgi:hemolysin activation/secretion protein
LAVTPLRHDTLLYADGGLVDPLPVDVANSLSEFPVVAVNTATGLAHAEDLTDPYAVANQATSVMTAPFLARSLEAADYVCTPDAGQIANVDFGAVDSLVAAGYQAGQETAAMILNDHNPDGVACDSALRAGIAPIVLADGLTPGDCAPGVASRVLSGEPLTRCAAQRLVEETVGSGWWQQAMLTAGADESGGGKKWILSARRPPILWDIRFGELKVFDDSTLREVMALPTGERHNLWTVARALNRIVDYYAQHDYTLTDISDATLSEDGTLNIHLDEALLVNVGLSGNRKVKGWVVLRNFPLKPGTPYNSRLIERGLNDLLASGLFEQVTTEVEHTDDGPRLRLTVTEKTTDAVRFGLHHDLEYQTEMFIEWAGANLLGLGNELVFHAQLSPRRDWFFLRARADRVFRTYLTSALTGYRHRHERRSYSEHEEIGTFTTDRSGFEFFVGQHITRKAQMALTLNVEELELDTSTDSERGRRLSAQLRWADDFFGGEVVYRAFDGEGMWVESPWDGVALQAAARFATAERRLPIYERFSLGGLHSFMGLNDDEFLGDKLVLTSFSGRYQFYTRSYLGARLDIGTVWDHNAFIDFIRDLRIGFGGGLMFDTPLGPLLIMGGIAEDDYSKLYFSWGYDF